MEKIALLLFYISIHVNLIAQDILSQTSKLDLNFGAGENIENIYLDNDILFTHVSKSYNILDEMNQFEKYAVGVFQITDSENPTDLGSFEKDELRGTLDLKDRVKYLYNDSLQAYYYALFDENNKCVNYFFDYRFKYVQKNDTIYFFKNYSRTISIQKADEFGTLTQINSFSLTSDYTSISGLEIVDNIIYLTSRSNKGLFLFNTSKPDTLIELENLYKNFDLTGLILGNNKAIIGKEFQNILVLDISNPFSPIELSTKQFHHNLLTGIWVNENLYLAGNLKDISIFDNDLNLKSTFKSSSYVKEIIANNSELILSSYFGIEILDVSDIFNISNKIVYGANISKPTSFVKRDNLLFVTNSGNGFGILDVSDKYRPKLINSLDINGSSRDLVVKNNYAFIADYLKGLVVIDFNDLNNFKIANILSSLRGLCSIDIMNNLIFALSDSDTLYGIDITAPDNPEIVLKKAFFTINNDYYFGLYKKIVIADNNIWVKLNDSPLYAFKLNDNLSLEEIFNYTNNFSNIPFKLSSNDSLIFLTSPNGLQIINNNNLSFILEEPFGATIESNPYSVVINPSHTSLFVSYQIYGIPSIYLFDATNLSDPVFQNGYYSLGYAAEYMILENDLLYVLSPSGIEILSQVIVDNIENNEMPTQFSLSQNYPNPFNPTTIIKYQISNNKSQINSKSQGSNRVMLKVYDVLGKEVATLVNETKQPGSYHATFDASNLASGMYYYRLSVGDFSETKKLILLK